MLTPKAVQTLETLAEHGELYLRYPGSGYSKKWYPTRRGGKPVTGIFTPNLDKLEDLGLIDSEDVGPDRLWEEAYDTKSDVERVWITPEGLDLLEEL